MIDFAPAFDFVREIAGLTFPQARVATVTDVFGKAMSERGYRTPVELVEHMRADAPLRDSVVAKLTIGETYFFRDPAQFDVLRDDVLPSLLQSRAPEQRLRMWSAAAASGEEAYTLAIITEAIGAADRVEIVATDIARPRLAHAQRARFGKWSMRGVPEETIARYFRPVDDMYELLPRLRDRVSFRYLNLAEDRYPSLTLGVYDMDVILCRNVLIYFDEPTVCRVAQRLLDSLSPIGWLFVGASDPPLSQLIECDVVTTAAGLAYRRPGAGGETALHARPQTAAQHDDTGAAERTIYIFPTPAPPSIADVPARKAETASFDVRESAAPPTSASSPTSSVFHTSAAISRDDALTAAYDVRDFAAVDQIAMQLTSHAGSTLQTWVLWLRALCNLGRTQDAMDVGTRALDTYSDAPELHYLLAVALSHEGRDEAAITAARRALYMDRTFVIAHVLLGQLYGRTGDRVGALRSFRNAAALLAGLDDNAIVNATDGERVERIRQVVHVQLRLLKAVA